MIVPMKKLHLVVESKDVDKTLEILRNLGVMHIEHLSEFKGHPLAHLHEEINHVDRAIDILSQIKEKHEQVKADDPRAQAHEINDLLVKIERLNESISKREQRIQNLEPWGNFNPSDIEKLKRNHVYIRFYEIPVAELKKLPEHLHLEVIFKEGGVARCMVIQDTNEPLPFEIIAPPPTGLNEEEDYQAREKEELKELNEKLNENTKYLDSICEFQMEQRDHLRFAEVRIGMKSDEYLSVLKGYSPEEDIEPLQDEARKQKWGILIEDVTEEDEVPTLLKNPEFINLSKPALDMIEILPGYSEIDVSPVFILFFTLFFAMLIGDAAYGAIFFALTLFFQMRLKDKVIDKKPFHLMYLLSGFTMVWGVLTGTYFGQQWLPENVNPIVPWLNDFHNIQWLCFTVALVHLSIARLWSFKKKLPALTAFAEIGWMLIIWGMYFLANMFVLNHELPVYALWFFAVGISLAFIFMVPFKYFLKKAPQEMIPFALSVVGAGTDIISYIRLFAVGLATVAVADAANSMPQALPGVGYALMVFLHILNLILASMAILVHAIRLNVLEFSGHLNLEWSGFRYNPFSKNIKQA